MDGIKIAFIGGGNMASSLIGGLVAKNFLGPNIHVSDLNQDVLHNLKEKFGIIPFYSDNIAAIKEVDIIVLATKPQVMAGVAIEIGNGISGSPLIISIAAGIREVDLGRWLGGHRAIIRTMPNTPALLQCGATGLYANSFVSEKQKSLAESIMHSVGITTWMDKESQLDAVTALSGSGPAYFFLLMEAMENAGIEMGLPKEVAHRLTVQTALGAAKMARENSDGTGELRKKVTSPGGTTERAIDVFRGDGFEQLVLQALLAARDRSEELARSLSAVDNT